jgi:hypothetical protein
MGSQDSSDGTRYSNAPILTIQASQQRHSLSELAFGRRPSLSRAGANEGPSIRLHQQSADPIESRLQDSK